MSNSDKLLIEKAINQLENLNKSLKYFLGLSTDINSDQKFNKLSTGKNSTNKEK